MITNHTRKFIEDAQKGGWKYQGEYPVYKSYIPPAVARFEIDGVDFKILREQALLDPKCWQAVGRQRGWDLVPVKCRHILVGDGTLDTTPDLKGMIERHGVRKEWWHCNMLEFIDHLAEGKDIESSLGEIE